jgi:hypothetical protein
MSKIDPNRIEEILLDCIGEDIVIEGIKNTYGLNPEKLKIYENEIYMMLKELPDPFQNDIGGGWSFCNACDDKNGEQWTGLHLRMEQLFVLGMGIGKVELC